jgi:hypothetical protein
VRLVAPEAPPAPVPGRTTLVATPAPAIEVVLRNGRVLRIAAGADAVTVARLAAALEA